MKTDHSKKNHKKHSKKNHTNPIEHHSTHYQSADAMSGEDKPKMFIQKAIKHPGALRKQLHAKKGKDIPEKKLESAAKKGGTLGKRARFAITLKRLAKHKKKK